MTKYNKLLPSTENQEMFNEYLAMFILPLREQEQTLQRALYRELLNTESQLMEQDIPTD